MLKLLKVSSKICPFDKYCRTHWFEYWLSEGSLREWGVLQVAYCSYMDTVVDMHIEQYGVNGAPPHIKASRSLAMAHAKSGGLQALLALQSGPTSAATVKALEVCV
jgi:hypothetical protein